MIAHPLLDVLNNSVRKDAPSLWAVLSKRGKDAFFPKMGNLAQGMDAEGKRINATIGVALYDDGTPMHLASVAEGIGLKPAEVFTYAPAHGIKPLRQEWAAQLHRKNPSLGQTHSLPVVTAGLTHSLSVAASLFLDPDDELIVPDPFWENYFLIFSACGAKLNMFPFFDGAGFNLSALKSALSGKPGKKVLLLNFPHNPTGYAPTITEARAIIEMLRACAEAGNDIVVFLDDAYFGLVYEDGIENESFFASLSCIHERIIAVKIDGVSKEDFAWGLRVGFLTFGSKGMTDGVKEALEQKTAAFIRGDLSNSCHLSQSLLLKAYRSPGYAKEKERNRRILENRYREAMRVAGDSSHTDAFTMLPCNSGYFLCIELKNGVDADAVRTLLLRDYDTGVIAQDEHLLRIAFSAVAEKEMEKLFSNIAEACRKVSS